MNHQCYHRIPPPRRALPLSQTQQQREPEIPTIHIHTGFFKLLVVLAGQVLVLPCVQEQVGEIAPRVKGGSTSRSRTREQGGDRDTGDTCVGARGSSVSRRPPKAIGNGSEDWNISLMSLRLVVGLQRQSVMGEFAVSVSSNFSSSWNFGS